MKILFYSPVSLHNGAGAEQWQLRVAAQLARQFGHEVQLMTCAYGAANLSEAELKRRLTVPHTSLAVTQPGGIPYLTKAARQQLRTAVEWADVVTYVFGFLGHDLYIQRLTRQAGKPVWAGFHAPILTHSRLHNLYVSTISRYLVLPHSTGFLYFNDAQRRQLTSWGFTQPAVAIGGAVDTDYFVPPKSRAADRFQGLYLGRFEVEKGVDILAAALDRLLAQHPDWKLSFTFVGSGSFEPQVKDLAERFPHQISLVGYQTDTRPFYQRAHLLVMPSRQETFGFATVEALASGLPVLASGADGPRQILQEGKTGWFVDPLTVEALQTALDRRYQEWEADPAAWAKKWAGPTRQAALSYSPEIIAGRLDKAFAEADISGSINPQ